jgi:hypothetical protein
LSDLSYSCGERLFLAGDEVLEVFGRNVDGSKRFPLAWVGVQIESRKGDQIRVSAGLAQAGEPFWTNRIMTTGPLSEVDLPAIEEPAVRAFFDELARRAGRA